MDPQGFFPLIVRGGRGIKASYDGTTLSIQFGKSRVEAGEPETYGRMPLGSAAWIDRPLNDAEPFVVKQQMSRSDAESTAAVLRMGERFWKFVCANTNAGHFETFRSEPAFMRVIIDHG